MLGAIAFLALTLWVAALHVPFEAEAYDEGLMVTGGALALGGRLPAADYYAPYPPGAFLTLALIFRLCGLRLLVERWFAAALAALIAAASFWLITGFRAESGRPNPLSWGAAVLTSLTIALLLASRWVTPVNGGALALLLASGIGLRTALARRQPAAAALCGALAGAAALWRLDFGLNALAASLVVWFLHGRRAGGNPEARRRPTPGLIGMGAAALLVSGPPLAWLLARGGHRAALSLFWWPFASTAAAHVPWTRHATAFLVFPAALFLAARGGSRLRDDPPRAGLALWLALVGFGFLGYALGRAHATHLLPLRVVSLLLAATAQSALLASPAGGIASAPHAASGRRRRAIDIALLVVVAAMLPAPVRDICHSRALAVVRHTPLPGPRGAGVYPSTRQVWDYTHLLAYLRREVSPDARLFCGTPRHDLFLKSDNLAYFLCARESGTYYWCLDAGVTSTWPVQREMTRELEASHVDVVLISTTWTNHEANAGARSSGVHLLDDYLRRNYRPAVVWDDYAIYRRCRTASRVSLR